MQMCVQQQGGEVAAVSGFHCPAATVTCHCLGMAACMPAKQKKASGEEDGGGGGGGEVFMF